MKHQILAGIAAVALGAVMTTTTFAADISGAGATFPYPIYAKWADAYKTETGNGLNYQSIGSGGGIKQIEAKTVTFGASDKPLGDEELAQYGLVQFPMVMGGIVPIVNLEGIKPGELVLDGPTLASIFLGKITSWDDAAIKALNPSLTLPATPIVVAHRSDGSGTTFNFTDFLVKVSPEWADQVGSDTAVEWPTGVGAKGNEGVAGTVKQTAGAIGYVEYAYATENNLSHTNMVNAAGKTVAPSLDSFASAAASADWAGAKNFNVIITNEPGDASWPIAASTWIIMYAKPDDPAASAEALKFFDWAYKNGKEAAASLNYVAMPDSVVEIVEKSWASIVGPDGKPVFSAM
ncbi:MAG TPA: phosphate ABC transporter substrate-binding protein PstS [Devosia sp.]|nr:phosphate ABC transporter substrate-binding protein PstS [Devosia sp.]